MKYLLTWINCASSEGDKIITQEFDGNYRGLLQAGQTIEDLAKHNRHCKFISLVLRP